MYLCTYIGAVTDMKVQLEEDEYQGKSSQSLMQHMASGLAASVGAGKQFDLTYMQLRKKSHKLTRLHDRLFREAVAWQARGQYDEAVNRYEQILVQGKTFVFSIQGWVITLLNTLSLL